MGAMTIVALLVPILFANVAVEMLLAWTGVSRGALTENPPVLAAAAVLGLTTYIAFIWLSLRLMLWPPAVVANNKLSLGEAWRLSRGNVFALLALAIASSVAFLVLGGAVAIAAAQTGAIDTLDLSKTLAFEGTPEARLTRIVEHRVNPHVIAYEFAFQFFVTTYAVAVLSYAYKALQGFDIDLPINGQQPGSGGMTPAFQPNSGPRVVREVVWQFPLPDVFTARLVCSNGFRDRRRVVPTDGDRRPLENIIGAPP